MNGIIDIKVGSETIRCKFGIAAMAAYAEDRGVDFEDFSSKFDVRKMLDLCDLIFFAAQSYAFLNDKEFPYTKTHARTWAEDIAQDDLPKIIETMYDIRIWKTTLKEMAADKSSGKKK